jgi:hypothetical protein
MNRILQGCAAFRLDENLYSESVAEIRVASRNVSQKREEIGKAHRLIFVSVMFLASMAFFGVFTIV